MWFIGIRGDTRARTVDGLDDRDEEGRLGKLYTYTQNGSRLTEQCNESLFLFTLYVADNADSVKRARLLAARDFISRVRRRDAVYRVPTARSSPNELEPAAHCAPATDEGVRRWGGRGGWFDL